MGSSVGKRQRERQKQERAQVKAERKAVRRAAGADEVDDLRDRNESDLVEELQALQRALEDGELSLEDFESRRSRIQEEFQRLTS